MPSAWVIYYFKTTFNINAMTLGLIFSINDMLQSVSAIPSAILARQFGPIKSTILTQIPCGLFFMMIPIVGQSLIPATVLYFLNQSLSATDVVPRQILLTSIVSSNDLPKVLGTVNIGKQIARSVSPYFTGLLAGSGLLWVCFIISAALLITANVLLAVNFRTADAEIMKKQSVHHDIEQ
ncbi:unnamed protein product [Ambrosiozyma monospora]|uniref:Unnamed protein product n=1 Tax=Ambrosiozyma monospora TaxID=43982 RepID=A0ACB5T9K9_AMBMO|nr:unnamed protein product [Ambrosiozyma monospora]